MRNVTWIFAALLCVGAVEAAAQDAPKWDISLSAGLFEGKPAEQPRIGYYENWFFAGRYAATVGRFWTNHFKTELEYSVTGEGSQYVQQLVRVPGTDVNYPLGVEVFHRIQHVSGRAVWQFFDNAWVHPYLNAGVALEIDRRRSHSPEQFFYPGDPRTIPPGVIRPEISTAATTDYHPGLSAGGGAKFYVSPAAFINTGMQVTATRRSTTFTFLAGLGMEF